MVFRTVASGAVRGARPGPIAGCSSARAHHRRGPSGITHLRELREAGLVVQRRAQLPCHARPAGDDRHLIGAAASVRRGRSPALEITGTTCGRIRRSPGVLQAKFALYLYYKYRWAGVVQMLIFLLGALLGVIAGGALCVRYLRREIAGDIGPKLKHMQLQLDNIETELNLVIATRHAELSASSPSGPHANCRHQHDQ